MLSDNMLSSTTVNLAGRFLELCPFEHCRQQFSGCNMNIFHDFIKYNFMLLLYLQKTKHSDDRPRNHRNIVIKDLPALLSTVTEDTTIRCAHILPFLGSHGGWLTLKASSV